MKEKTRCAWVFSEPLYTQYHDEEWGVPIHDDPTIFEFLVLESFQAGLSWAIVLKKREAFRAAFDQFDVHKISKYKEKKVQQLLQNPAIIRNRQKIAAAINNAQRFLEVQKEFGSFDRYIWQFGGGKPIINRWQTIREIPATSKESDEMSKDLKKRGFKFVGSTICYAHMQATGMVNDHTTDCFRYAELAKLT